MHGNDPLQQTSSNDGIEDLQFMTSIDTNASQNVPIPNQHQVPPLQQPNVGSGPMDNPAQATLASSSPPLGLQILKGAAHPVACIFHCIFKMLSLFLYIFNGLFFANKKGVNFITITVCCILLLAMDFWVVKNVTGRLLVGLRWWTKLAQDGTTTEWIFESASSNQPNAVDSSIFWTVLYVTPVIWSFLLFTALVRLHFGWMITVILALTMTGSNVYGYWKCSSDQKAKFQRLMARGTEMGAMTLVKNNFFGIFNRSSNQSQPETQATPSVSFV